MNPSTVPRNSESDKVWRRRAARKLRNWLNDYLMQGEALELDRTLEAGVGQNTGSRGSPRPADAVAGGDAAPASVALDRSESEASGGPPDHWLKRVREDAPELLLSPKDDGVPYCSVDQLGIQRRTPMAGRSPNPSDMAPPSPVPLVVNSDAASALPRPPQSFLKTLLQPFFRERAPASEEGDTKSVESTIPPRSDSAADLISSKMTFPSSQRPELQAAIERRESVTSFARRAKQDSAKVSANRSAQPAGTRGIRNSSDDSPESAGRRIVQPIPELVYSASAIAPVAESTTTRSPNASSPVPDNGAKHGEERARPAPRKDEPEFPHSFRSRYREGVTPRSAERSQERFRGSSPASSDGEFQVSDPGPMETLGFSRVHAHRTPSLPEFDGVAKPQWARVFIPANLPEITPDLWPELPEAPPLQYLDSQSAQRDSERSRQINSEQRGES